mmetsp:Transcript_24425/g.36635  ORF Transcript_24425/g.36635 Transcript_24425/m.36635 type:complete len:140 (-) Transcript_24425:152-571(-)
MSPFGRQRRVALFIAVALGAALAIASLSQPRELGIGKRKKKVMPLVVPSQKVYSLLKQIHPDMRISKKAMRVMNSFVNDQFERIAEEAGKMLSIYKKSTLTSREIQACVRLLLPGELAKHAVSRGTKALAMYNENMSSR